MEGRKILVMAICRNFFEVAFVGKSTHTKRGKSYGLSRGACHRVSSHQAK